MEKMTQYRVIFISPEISNFLYTQKDIFYIFSTTTFQDETEGLLRAKLFLGLKSYFDSYTLKRYIHISHELNRWFYNNDLGYFEGNYDIKMKFEKNYRGGSHTRHAFIEMQKSGTDFIYTLVDKYIVGLEKTKQTAEVLYKKALEISKPDENNPLFTFNFGSSEEYFLRRLLDKKIGYLVREKLIDNDAYSYILQAFISGSSGNKIDDAKVKKQLKDRDGSYLEKRYSTSEERDAKRGKLYNVSLFIVRSSLISSGVMETMDGVCYRSDNFVQELQKEHSHYYRTIS